MVEPIVLWDLEDDPAGNYVHIVVEHGILQSEVEEVMQNPKNTTRRSRSSGRPITFGWTSLGRYIAVIWEEASDNPKMIKPVTAYETNPPQRKKRP